MNDFEYLRGDLEFPGIPTDRDINKGYNPYDYTVWTPGTRLRLYRAPWDDVRNAPDFSTDEKRNAWFDNHAHKTIELKSYYYLNKSRIKLPIPGTNLYAYNYLLIDYGKPPVNNHTDIGMYSYGFFIDSFVQLTPSVSQLELRLDIMGTFMRFYRPQGQLMRGHYAYKHTTTDEFFQNPINHNESLCDDDVYAINPQTVKSQTFLPYGDGEPWLLIGLRADPPTVLSMGTVKPAEGDEYTNPQYYDTPDRWGYQYGVKGYAWNLLNGDFTGTRTDITTGVNPDGVNGAGVYIYAVKGSDAKAFLHALAEKASHIMQLCVGVMICPGSFIGKGDTFSWLGFDVFVCDPVYDLSALPIKPTPEAFGYPAEFRKYTKLYTSQYALMIMRDDQAHEVAVKLESCGNLNLQKRFVCSYPIMKMQAWLSGYATTIKDAKVSVTRLDGGRADRILPGVDFELQSFGYDFPTYAVGVSGSRVWAMNSMYAWDRIEALNSYHKNVRNLNTNYENTKQTASVNKANTLRSNDTTQGNGHRTTEDAKNNALDSARTANANALRSNATAYANALASAATGRTNANASAYAGEQNAFASNQTAQANANRSLENSVTNTNESNKAQTKGKDAHKNYSSQQNIVYNQQIDSDLAATVKASNDSLSNSNLGMDQMQDLKNGAATHQAAVSAASSVVGGTIGAITGIASGGKAAGAVGSVVGGLSSAAFGLMGNAIAVGDNNKIKEAQKLINSESQTIQQTYNSTKASIAKSINGNNVGNTNALSDIITNINTNLASKITDNNRKTGEANAAASRGTGDGNAARSYNTAVANAQRSYDTSAGNAARSKSTGDANANASLTNAKVIAERNYATGIANIDRTHGNVVHNTDDSYNNTLATAGYSREAGVLNAKTDLEAAPLKRKYEAENAANSAPVLYGAQSGDPTPDVTGMRGVRVYYKTGTAGQVRRVATEFARFGYNWDTYVNMSVWNVMSIYTYWRMSQADINMSEPVSQEVSEKAKAKLEAGITVWGDPDKIGKVNIYDNK